MNIHMRKKHGGREVKEEEGEEVDPLMISEIEG